MLTKCDGCSQTHETTRHLITDRDTGVETMARYCESCLDLVEMGFAEEEIASIRPAGEVEDAHEQPDDGVKVTS